MLQASTVRTRAQNRWELGLLNAVEAGEVYDGGGGKIRSVFLRDILLAAPDIPNAALGVGMTNVLVQGELNISGMNLDMMLSITNSQIDGNFKFNHTALKALFLDGTQVCRLQGVRCRISSSIYLRSAKVKNDDNTESFVRFHAKNGVDVSGAKIEGALSARGALIECKNGLALNLADSEISSIILGPKDQGKHSDIKGPDEFGFDCCRVKGGISFQRARCQSFTDSEQVYSALTTAKPKGAAEKSELVLSGFTYESLGRLAPTRLQFRKKWLKLDERREEIFDPQPYEQLSKVLRAKGEVSAAQSVLMAKQRHATLAAVKRDFRIFETKPLIGLLLLIPITLLTAVRALKVLLMEPIGYGFRPFQLLPAVIACIFAGTLVFNHAYATGQLSPANPIVSRSKDWSACSALAIPAEPGLGLRMSKKSPLDACFNEPLGPQPSDDARAIFFYPDFEGFWYSVDVFLPILVLRQEEFWVATDQSSWNSVRTFTHMFTLLGWLLSSLGIVGALSYLNRS